MKKHIFNCIAEKEEINVLDFNFIMTGRDMAPITNHIYKNYKHVGGDIDPPPSYNLTFLSQRYETFIFSLYNVLYKLHTDLEEGLDKIKRYKYICYVDSVDMNAINIFYCLTYLKILNYYSSYAILTLSEFERKFTEVLQICNDCILRSKKLLKKIT